MRREYSIVIGAIKKSEMNGMIFPIAPFNAGVNVCDLDQAAGDARARPAARYMMLGRT